MIIKCKYCPYARTAHRMDGQIKYVICQRCARNPKLLLRHIGDRYRNGGTAHGHGAAVRTARQARTA